MRGEHRGPCGRSWCRRGCGRQRSMRLAHAGRGGRGWDSPRDCSNVAAAGPCLAAGTSTPRCQKADGGVRAPRVWSYVPLTTIRPLCDAEISEGCCQCLSLFDLKPRGGKSPDGMTCPAEQGAVAHPGALSSVSIITKAKCTLPGSSSQCFPDRSPALDFIPSPRLISASVSHRWCLSLPASPVFVFSISSDLLFSPSPLVLPQQHLHSTASLPPTQQVFRVCKGTLLCSGSAAYRPAACRCQHTSVGPEHRQSACLSHTRWVSQVPVDFPLHPHSVKTFSHSESLKAQSSQEMNKQ